MSDQRPVQSLADINASGAWPQQRAAVDVVIGLLAGVQTVHRGGSVHGALAPSLIEVHADGRTVIHAPAEVRDARYASPEVKAGSAPTRSDDCYSVGAILYEMLAGFPPVATAAHIQSSRDIAEAATVAPQLAAVVMRALALDPHERYPSAEVFRSDLVDVRPLLPGGSFTPSPSVARPQPPSRFNPVVATIVALALVGIALLLYFLLRNDSVRIPAVTGQTAAAAQRTLADAGLRSSLVHEKSTDVAVGRAIRTDPAAGSEVANDSAVLVVINGNQADIRVPSLIGQAQAAAADNLSQLGLRATFSQTRDAAPAGTVVGQSPPPAASVAPGTIVTLTVSSGAPTQTVERTTTVQTTSTVTTPAPAPATVRVPTATGMTLDEASRAITDAGLAIGTITNERTQSQPPGTVIRQDPPAGSRVGPGAQVALVVAAA